MNVSARSQQSHTKKSFYCLLFKIIYVILTHSPPLSMPSSCLCNGILASMQASLRPHEAQTEMLLLELFTVIEHSMYIRDTRPILQNCHFRSIFRDHYNGLTNLENQSKFQGGKEPCSHSITAATVKATNIVTCWR